MKTPKGTPVIWALSKHIPSAFELGINADAHDSNPFATKTNEWYSWNRGYNLSDKNLSRL